MEHRTSEPKLSPYWRMDNENKASHRTSKPLLLVAHFDGSCNPNPNGQAAYGWHIDVEDLENELWPLAEDNGPVTGPRTSNNIAEWRGLQSALEWLVCYRGRVEQLTIVGDSQLVIRQLNGEWACKKPYLAVLRDDCLRLLGRMGYSWRATWMPREANGRADELSKRR